MKLDETDVFISFHEDMTINVNELYSKLNLKFRTTMQHNQWQRSQLTLNDCHAQDIKKSKVFLCCLTKKYFECIEKRKELIYALRLDKKILVLNYDRVNMNDTNLDSDEFNLENVEQIQFDDYDLIEQSIENILKVKCIFI